MDGSNGRKVRRSRRVASASESVLASVGESPAEVKGAGGSGKVANITPSADTDAEDVVMRIGERPAKKRKGGKSDTASASTNKSKSPTTPNDDEADELEAKESPYFSGGGVKSKAAATKKKKKAAPRRGRKLLLASDEEESGETCVPAGPASTTSKRKSSKKSAGKKPRAPLSTDGECIPVECIPVEKKPKKAGPKGGEPDGNGGLNQAAPYIVEYSKSGRATCKTCDERILKGSLRVGHRPLFRGKPGFMVYRHLHCTTFSAGVRCAEDVGNYDSLTPEDYVKLAEQVDVSEEKNKEEEEELSPDELVQKNFEGEIRSEPRGLTATLLPFQTEGFSWMRHQEVMTDIHGGVLADEMGMGKTLQTIATILDNRPKLQHAKPGMKHPPCEDLLERQAEDVLWKKAKSDWSKEMEILKVPKKLRLKDGGSRAGTLVICPVIALTQWKTEIEKFTESGTLSVCVYHGPDREKTTPRALMKKYDVVLTTYQVLEADFRKMTSPNKVACPNCGGKFKVDKLPIHLKYFCGEGAERTEAQARTQRNPDRGGGSSRRRPGSSGGKAKGKGGKKTEEKKSSAKDAAKKPALTKKAADDSKKPPSKKPKKMAAKKPPKNKSTPKIDEEDDLESPRSRSKRSASKKASSAISKSSKEWIGADEDSDGDNFDADDAAESESESEEDYSSDSSDDSALARAREKQRLALEAAASKKGKKKAPAKKKTQLVKGKKPLKGKGKQGKKRKFDDDDDDGDDSSGDDRDPMDGIDLKKLMDEAMTGAKNSVLHSFSWWRIVLDEAHFIKSRSSQTANAAFSLIGVNRWALSGTPLQNRVGEFYSLVRFLRLDPMAYYMCKANGCDCTSMHYRMTAGRCDCCGHSSIQHFSYFNRYVLNPIQRDGYSGDGRRAMFRLKEDVLDKALLRRTKETRAADMELPPRIVQIKPVRLHPVEEDFYSALYTQTKSSFNDYVDSGTLLNNYAHIFDLLIRMRQSVDHPYLVVHSKKNTESRARQASSAPAVANGSTECDLCHEPPTDRVVSTCCGSAYCRSCVMEYMATSSTMAAESNITCPSCQQAFSVDLQGCCEVVEDDSTLTVSAPKAGDCASNHMPSLKELPHVATGSILRRINLSEFATSSKIEALTRELVLMRQTSPGSKAIVFSQFVNMLDLIRWRVHSDPYLEGLGLGIRALHGGMNVKARDAVLKDFREDNNVRVLLMSLKAGGVALNLTCANHIYLMDPWWNPFAEMQAIDRTHRIGQYRPIRAIRFIAMETVEERILQLQEKKRLIFDGTVGRDAGSLKMLTVDDMKSLFA